MGLFAAGQVVALPFPYSDLSGQKLRPALLLANAGHNDWIICQITSNPFSDPAAIQIGSGDFVSGGIHHTSYIRPSKLFTANESIIASVMGTVADPMLWHAKRAAADAVRA